MTHYSRTELSEIETELCMQFDQVREDILHQIHQSDDPEVLALANHIDEGCDWSEADLLSETDVARLRQKTLQLRDIEIALERIKSGSYGICSKCGNTIPASRLRAQITCETCVGCQEKAEKLAGTAVPHSL